MNARQGKVAFSKIKKKINKIIEEIKNFRFPWLPFLWHPHFSLSPPTVDLTKERNRLTGFLLFVLVSSVLFGGLIFLAVELPPPLVTVGRGRPGYILPRKMGRGQTTMEGFIVALLFLIGSLGLLLIKRSSKNLIKEEETEITFYAGYALIFLAVVSFVIIYYYKMGLV